MRVAINLRSYFHDAIGGLESVVRRVLPGLIAGARADWRFTVFAQESECEHLADLGAEVSAVSEEHQIRRELESGDFGLLLCPLLVLEPLTPRIPSVVWIPDLQHEYFPENFAPEVLAWRRRSYRASVLHADAVIVFAEHVRSSIAERFAVDAEKVHAIPLAADLPSESRASPPEPASPLPPLPESYLYYPANFWPHKNHSTLLAALRELHRDGHDLALVLTGAPGTGPSPTTLEHLRREIRRQRLQDRVHLLGLVPRSQIAEIYRRALAVVLPSRHEGFGLPVLEAFACSTPVIAASSTSYPEVSGDAALLVDEDDPEAIAAAVERLLTDAQLRSDLVRRGERRAADLTWERTVAATLAVIERAVEAHSKRPAIELASKPAVAVVTPSLNQAPFLAETIASVLGQDYPDIDYLVMDGGSTDGSQEILAGYSDRLRYVVAADGGQADAVNRGFELTRGEVFAFLNADDTYLPGAVARGALHLQRFPGIAAVYGEGLYVDENGADLAPYPTQPFDAARLERNCFICQPASFLRRDAFAEVGGLDTRLRFSLDYDLWIRLSRSHALDKIDHPLATSRLYPDNKTLGSRSAVFRETLRCGRRHFGYAAYDWIFGYAHYLAHPHAPFLEPPPAGRRSHLYALVLGLIYNRRHVRRFWSEWARALGLSRSARAFDSRWADGWMSRRYRQELWLSADAQRLVVRGRHLDLGPSPLTLTLRLNRRRLLREELEPGAFELSCDCPPSLQSTLALFEIEANRTFSPGPHDPRRLSCLLDSVSCE